MVYCIFGAVGLGMASPYLLIGVFPELIRFLPKPGAWMDTFKQLMGFLLLATVVYLFNSLTAVYCRAHVDAVGWAVVRVLVDRTHAVDQAGANGRWPGAAARRGGAGRAVRLHRAPSAVENRLAALFARGGRAGPRRRQDGNGRFHRQLVPELQAELAPGHRNQRGSNI